MQRLNGSVAWYHAPTFASKSWKFAWKGRVANLQPGVFTGIILETMHTPSLLAVHVVPLRIRRRGLSSGSITSFSSF